MRYIVLSILSVVMAPDKIHTIATRSQDFIHFDLGIG